MISTGNRFPLLSSDLITGCLHSSYPISRRKPKILSASLTIIICSIFFLVVISPVTALDWTIETVDSAGNVGWYTSLALNNSGNPRISYLDWDHVKLKYAAKNGGFWTNETVDTTTGNGEYSSLKLDNSGHPLISYYDLNIGNLSFATKTGSSWTKVVIDSGGAGRHSSLAIDSAGNPRISYQYLSNGGKLKYAQKTGNNWTNETVDSSGNVGSYSSLALDSSGNPHISYYDATNGDLKYAVKNGSQWTNSTVDNTGNVGYSTSIALDGNENPSISYYDGGNKRLKYATKTGSSWTTVIVDRVGSDWKYTSLAFDSFGNPHISYFDETNGHLKYAHKTGSVWTTEIVDPAANVGAYSSLALDSSGIPRISYRDGGNGDLKYATGIAPLKVNFSASIREGTAPLAVNFSDTSTGGLPFHWNWSFGDGTWYNTSNASLRNPEHMYETPGTHNVSLTIRNFSITSILSRTGYIVVVPPIVTPTPTPNSTSTPIPTISPTPSPTSTPEPTPTPGPTVTPTPSTTPVPETTPTPDPTISPTPQPDPTPSTGPTLSVSTDAGDGGGDDILPGFSTTPYPVGEGPLDFLTVNVGGDSAIRRVTVTGKNISGIIVTANKVESSPSGFPKIPISVYQYVDVKPAQFSVITDVQLEFDIPNDSNGDQNITRKDVGMYLFQNGTWIALPISATGIKNGRVLYRAGSPEFSLFAITINNAPSGQSLESAFTIFPDTDTIPAERGGDPKMPAFANRPVTPTIPDTSAPERPAQPVFSGIFVISVIVISAVLVRHWWIRRQNPP